MGTKWGLSIEERFWMKVNRPTAEGCWEWTAYRKADGYGAMRVDGRTVTAHRISWYLHTGSWPTSGDLVCHHCDNPPCVNPGHLYLGDHATNARDMFDRKRVDRRIGPRARCAKGLHEMSGENVYTDPAGRRRCRACFAAWRDDRSAKRNEDRVAL